MFAAFCELVSLFVLYRVGVVFVLPCAIRPRLWPSETVLLNVVRVFSRYEFRMFVRFGFPPRGSTS